MDKFLHAAIADYEALNKERDMINYLVELYIQLDKLDPENHSIDAHWSMVEGEPI